MEAPTLGSIVHYVDEERGLHSAEVVNVLDAQFVNLVVTLDGGNASAHVLRGTQDRLHAWMTSIAPDPLMEQWDSIEAAVPEVWTTNCWHWPPARLAP